VLAAVSLTLGSVPQLRAQTTNAPAPAPAATAPAPAATAPAATPTPAVQTLPPSILNGKTLKVGMRLVPPFVMKKEDGTLTGFSYELWKQIELATGLKTELTVIDTLPNVLNAVKTKQVDLAIYSISITAKRELEFDFSQPMFDSGLLVAVRADSASNAGAFSAIQRMLTSGPILNLLGILALLILIPAHLVWLSERRHASKLVSRNYFPGIIQAIWWATGAAGGQQQDYPHSVLGKFISAMYVFISVVFVAYFTAAVASAMTVAQLKGDIAGPQDLPGRKVGIVAGSSSGTVAKEIGAKTSDFPNVNDALDALQRKQVDAVVYDAPVLLYNASHDGIGKVEIAGSLFHRENYGILLPQGTELRKPINEALLRLRENGLYDALYNKWFLVGSN
jgi:polar amino acid transport system substrate-binding protein